MGSTTITFTPFKETMILHRLLVAAIDDNLVPAVQLQCGTVMHFSIPCWSSALPPPVGLPAEIRRLI